MARLIPDISEVNVKRSLQDEMKSKLKLSYNGFDSIANAFTETVADELVFLRRQVQSYFEDYQITNVVGEKLDNLAFEMFGLTRIADSIASVTALERNIYFYASTGTFGDLNENQDFVIPRGTLLSNNSNLDTATIIYETDEDVTLISDESRTFVSATAIASGFNFNVDTDSLVYHNFTDYSLSNYGGLNVTNLSPILNGRDLESDLIRF